MYIIKCETDHQPRLDAWGKCSGLVHWDDPEGGDGEGGGSGVQDGEQDANPWLIHVNVWQNPLQYCKVISLQLIKINEKNKNKSVDQDSWYYTWQLWTELFVITLVCLTKSGFHINCEVAEFAILFSLWYVFLSEALE